MPRSALTLFRPVLPRLLGRCQGRLCNGVSGMCPGRLCHGVSGLGRCPGLVLVLAVAVGRRKHNFTQLNRIKIHNFYCDQCGAP